LPRAEENTVDGATLVGCSILVLEEQAFVARCLRILLQGAGAEVHSATNTADALYLIDRTALSAAVLSCSKTTKGCRRIIQRLARLDLPVVLCKDVDQNEAWPGIPALIKPVIGIQLVGMLHGLILADDNKTPTAQRLAQAAGRANLKVSEQHIRFPETPS
jgi:CheY-like chemotaxis protein